MQSRYGVQPGRALIAGRGLTLEAVAELAGVPKGELKNTLLGNTVPPPDLAQAVADALGVLVAELFTSVVLDVGTYRGTDNSPVETVSIWYLAR
jgi:transcriptional regulator with XRE-family HTH domain